MAGAPAPTPSTPDRGRAGASTAQWLIVVLLAVIATLLWTRQAPPLERPAFGQLQSTVGARGVFAFAGQLDRGTYGLFMLDVERDTVWCYELVTVDGERKLKLVAARTYTWDRYLRDYNGAAPSVPFIKNLVNRQNEYAGDSAAADD